MTAIADKFGKASISSNYAVATTVKTARTAGVTVLETFDLSKFAPDTPVFFLTYKKTTNPTTGEISITNQTSWKALVNPDLNTLTNMTLAPGYTDIGNAVGDFVECIPTSFWSNSLIEGILSFANPDATLRTDAVKAALNTDTTDAGGWSILANTPTISATNGNGSFNLTFPGADYTDRLSRGMRLRIPRTTTAPTQMADLESTSTQYAVKSSPSGITFLDDFTVEAWLKVESYPASGEMNVLSRTNGVSGWYLSIANDGRLQIVVQNATSTFEFGRTIASVPIGRKVHVAMTMDLSGNLVTAYMNGQPIQIEYSAGTGLTTIAQAGNLEIGAVNGASGLYDGMVSEVRLWSTIRTQAQVLDNMNKQLTGSETGLIGYWKLNGDWNDSTSNVNHMTPTGSPVFVTESPMSNTCYAIITTKPVYGGADTTLTVQCPEGYNIPNETLGIASYSLQKAPYGFPMEKELWSIVIWIAFVISQGSAGSETIYDSKLRLLVPAGNWKISWKAILNIGFGSAVAAVVQGGLSTNTTTNTIPELWFRSRVQNVVGNRPNGFLSHEMTMASATTLNFLFGGAGGTATTADIVGTDNGGGYLKIECGYL